MIVLESQEQSSNSCLCINRTAFFSCAPVLIFLRRIRINQLIHYMLGQTESLVRIDAHFIVLYDTPQKSFSHLIAIPETIVQGGKKLVAKDCIFICIYFVAVILSSTGFGDTHVPTND